MRKNLKNSSNPPAMVSRDLGIAYALHPFKRNQDVIKIHDFGNGDGESHLENHMEGDIASHVFFQKDRQKNIDRYSAF